MLGKPVGAFNGRESRDASRRAPPNSVQGHLEEEEEGEVPGIFMSKGNVFFSPHDPNTVGGS